MNNPKPLIFDSRQSPGSVVVYDHEVSPVRPVGMIVRLDKNFKGGTHRYIPVSGPASDALMGNSYKEVKTKLIKELRP